MGQVHRTAVLVVRKCGTSSGQVEISGYVKDRSATATKRARAPQAPEPRRPAGHRTDTKSSSLGGASSHLLCQGHTGGQPGPEAALLTAHILSSKALWVSTVRAGLFPGLCSVTRSPSLDLVSKGQRNATLLEGGGHTMTRVLPQAPRVRATGARERGEPPKE